MNRATTTSTSIPAHERTCRKGRPIGLVAALTLALCTAAPAVQAGDADGKIVLVRSQYNSNGTLRSSHILRVNADGSGLEQLTPATPGVSDTEPNWSSGGGRIAFTRYESLTGRRAIHVMNSRGGNDLKVTVRPGHAYLPVWGPHGTIAFVTEFLTTARGTQYCVGTVWADGREEHRLFCPREIYSSRPTRIDAIAWSADGQRVYVSTYAGNGLEDDGFSVSYEVDLHTRVAVELGVRHFFFQPEVSFAPDGSSAVYSERDFGISRFDFATDEERLLTDNGYGGRYSKDGSRIAFTRTFIAGDERYDQLFVMDADGSNVRQLTQAQVDNLEYRAVEWSEDGSQLLLNRTIYVEDDSGSRTVARQALRIIDVNTGAIKALPGGRSNNGGWFQ